MTQARVIVACALGLLLGISPSTAGATGTELDPTFGTDGIAMRPAVGDEEGSTGGELFLEPDGRLIVLGTRWVPGVGSHSTVFGYAADGSPDSGFGGSGTGFADLRTGYGGPVGGIGLPGGKVLIVSADYIGPGPAEIRLIRLLGDGTVDPSFGDHGVVRTPLHTYGGIRMALTPDGKLILAITTPSESQAVTGGGAVMVARLRPDGSLDPSFSGDGTTVVADPKADFTDVGPVVVSADGRVTLAAAGAGRRAGDGVFIDWPVFFQFDASGELESGFGNQGRARLEPEGSVTDLAQTPDGGFVGVGRVPSDPRNVDSVPAALKIDSSGALDPGFARDGLLVLRKAGLGGLNRLQLEDDGSILAAGYGDAIGFDDNGNEPGSDFLLVRLQAAGKPDRAFAPGGIVLQDIAGGNYDSAADLAVQAGGRIVVAGTHLYSESFRGPDYSNLTLVRYIPGDGDTDGDGRPDDTDRCPGAAARHHRGCPLFKRSITLHTDGLAFTGRVRSNNRRCVRTAVARIDRLHHGKHEVVGVDRHLNRGRYSITPPLQNGRYSATVGRDVLPNTGICPFAKSLSLTPRG